MELVVLVPDLDFDMTMNALLKRPAALGTRRFEYQVFRHSRRDPGCRFEAATFLAPYVNQADHALVLYDREGGWSEHLAAADLARDSAAGLAAAGWGNRSGVIVVDPEIEAWVWSESPEVDRVLGWTGRRPSLRQWLTQQGWLSPGAAKPSRPKEAFKAAANAVSKRPSASLFADLARTVSVRRCTDPAFGELVALLQAWFPQVEDPGAAG